MKEDKSFGVKEVLPGTGMMNCADLAAYLGMRPDNLKNVLKKQGVKTLNFSRHGRYRLVNLAELSQLK